LIRSSICGIMFMEKIEEERKRMDQINSLDLKTYISNAVVEVFDAMLSMDAEFLDDPESFRG
jgi:hypothetical protein